MISTISSWGNSLGLRIPKKEAERFGITVGSRIKIVSSKEGILIKPVANKGKEFEYLLGREQLSTLSKAQYTAYVGSLSQMEKEEIWRREDRNENIPDKFLKDLEKEADPYFSESKEV